MRVVAATSNRGKLAELSALLAARGWQVVAQAELGVASGAETAVTFIENALQKARHACAQTGLAAIADDSGLEVDALHGAPGIYSARYAGANAAAADNIGKLLTALSAVETAKRTARFHCALAYMRHPTDPSPLVSVGTWEGRIARAPRGDNGFGYDPIFLLDALGKTAAQLSASVKNQLSHRRQALRRLQASLPGLRVE